MEIFDVETIDYDQNHDEHENEESLDDRPLQIDTSDEQDILILNANVTVPNPTKDKPEPEQNVEHHQADSSATSSTRSRGRSSTRRTGEDASPSLRSGSTGRDADTTNSTIGNITAGNTNTEGIDDESNEESGIDSENHDPGNNSPKYNTKTTEKDIITKSTTALRGAAKRR